MNVRKEAGKGHLEGLLALRDTLAAAIDSCDSMRDLAALANRFQAVSSEIAELQPEVKEQARRPMDEIARKRAELARKRKTG